ncbi:hypothetical protein G6F56_009071 [Rhizopus delemar]|nr:hypothetical protein G6F56_009071 [Rhizopus delemar]
METGERSKYPLVNCRLNVMYGVVYKLGPSLKANFPGLMEHQKLIVLVFHGFWSFLNSYVKMIRKMNKVT